MDDSSLFLTKIGYPKLTSSEALSDFHVPTPLEKLWVPRLSIIDFLTRKLSVHTANNLLQGMYTANYSLHGGVHCKLSPSGGCTLQIILFMGVYTTNYHLHGCVRCK